MTTTQLVRELNSFRLRTARGDERAAGEFQRRFGEGVRRMVRHVLRSGRPATAVEAAILDEARRRGGLAPDPRPDETLIGDVAAWVGERLLAPPRPGVARLPERATIRRACAQTVAAGVGP